MFWTYTGTVSKNVARGRELGLQETWQKSGLSDSRHWPIWPLLRERLPSDGKFLDIGPGCWPTLPVEESYFIDISSDAMRKLGEVGGRVLVGRVENLPYQSRSFDLVCAFEILEHIEAHEEALAGIFRVLKDKGIFVLSVPLFAKYWSYHDDWAGHVRRYHPADLEALLERLGFVIEWFFCPRNLNTFMTESRLIELTSRAFSFAVKYVPSIFVVKFCNLYTRSPLNRMRGVAEASWEREGFGEIEDRSDVIVICRKAPTAH